MKRPVVLLLLFVFTALQCVNAKDSRQKLEKILPRQWAVVSAVDASGHQLYGAEDALQFSFTELNNYFSIHLPGDSLLHSGSWKLSGDTLHLMYAPEDIALMVDSLRFERHSGKGSLSLFSKGEHLSDITEGGVFKSDTENYFFIVEIKNKDEIRLVSDSFSYTLRSPEHSTAALDAAGGFSLMSLLRGMLGLFVVLLIAWIFSTNRKAISWRIVLLGLLTQITIAVLVMKVSLVQGIFEFGGKVFIKILDFSKVGSSFLLESYITGQVEAPLISFAFQILPTITFFSALTSILFYYGIIQRIVAGLAWLLKKLLRISGPESLSACGNIFVGQTEAPLLIKEYLPLMNRSEIMLVMVGGMATIAGGVLAIYIGLLGGQDPMEQMLFAKHLISASVMAAHGGVVAAKMLVPQTEAIKSEIKVSRDKVGSNILDAITTGTSQGVKLAVNVAALLLVIIALIAMINYIFGLLGDWTHLNVLIADLTHGQYDSLSMQFLLGYSLSPIAWALGVCPQDMALVGQLLGEKTILNEMVAFISLKDFIDAGAFASEKSIIMSTYLLCGFANFSSIGIQLGGIGALAPGQRKTLSQLGFRALLGGTLASLLSATIVGIIIGG